MRHCILLVSFFCLSSFVKAQSIKQVSVSVLKESTAFPFTRFFPIHPGVEIGVTLMEKQHEKSIRNFNVNLGGFHHKHIANAFYLKGEYAFRPIIKSLLSIDFIGNAGYMHTFYPSEVYELNTNSGEFEKITQYGRPHFTGGLGLGITYLKGKKIHPFLRQELIIQSPFANGIPVMVHSILKFGINIQLQKHQ